MIGTRASKLALWQAHHVQQRLEAAHPGLAVALRTIRTRGDLQREVPVGRLAGKGFFVREIEEALLRGEVDLAVHSLKDLPSQLPGDLVLAGVLERADPRDALVSAQGWSLESLPRGCVLGTGSLRRRAQLRHARADLETVPLRGNVDTRLRKLAERACDALVLAVAGLERLGVRDVPVRPLPVDQCLPAVGQGALALEARADDAEVARWVVPLRHAPTERAIAAERAWLARLGGGCLAPATAYARTDGDRLRLEAMVAHPDGGTLLRRSIEGPAAQAESLGEKLACEMLEAGAAALLEAARAEPGDAAR